MRRPTQVIILGVPYKIEYVDNPANVDVFKRESLWGQVDYWTRSIRVFDNNLPEQEVWSTIFHELLHAIGEIVHLSKVRDLPDDEIDTMARVLVDTMVRNKWIEL